MRMQVGGLGSMVQGWAQSRTQPLLPPACPAGTAAAQAAADGPETSLQAPPADHAPSMMTGSINQAGHQGAIAGRQTQHYQHHCRSDVLLMAHFSASSCWSA